MRYRLKKDRFFKNIMLAGLGLTIILMMFYGFNGLVRHVLFPVKYGFYIEKYAKENHLSPYLVLAVIKAESGFDPQATSRKNARGLMQITKDTGAWGARSLKLENYSFDSLYEPEVNIKIGCWYLKQLIKQFGSQTIAIAAYNGGSGNVSRWLKNTSYSRDGKVLNKIPFRETEKYVEKVSKNYWIYKKLYEKSF